MKPQTIPLRDAVLCISCNVVSNSRGETCAYCGWTGSLLNLSRILNPTPELGSITYLYAGGEA